MSEKKGEVNRQTELSDKGYWLSEKPCPDCGAFVWQFDKWIRNGFEGDIDDIVETTEECVSCGWVSVSYDG